MDKVKFIKPVEVDQLKVTGTINSSDIASQYDVTINTPDAKFSVGGPGFNYWHSKFGGIELHALEVGANEDGSDTGTIFAPYENSYDGEIYIANADRSKEAFLSTTEINLLKSEIGAKSAVTTLETRRNAIIKKGSAEGSTISGSAYNGVNPAATAAGAHSEGGGTQAKSDGAHTEGVNTVAGRLSQADTTNTTKVAQIIAPAATKLGMPFSTTAEQQAAVLKLGGFGAHAEGFNTQALGTAAHAEGNTTQALANSTHAEGDTTIAFGEASHAEGYNTRAKGNQSHAEGLDTEANGNASHTEGRHTKTAATAAGAHAEGISTEANADGSHASGIGTRATQEGQTVVGKYNDNRVDLFTVGCGTENNDRKSAFGVNTAGNTYVQNKLFVHGGATFTKGTNSTVTFNDTATFNNGINTNYIQVGSTKITESQLQQLLTLLN